MAKAQTAGGSKMAPGNGIGRSKPAARGAARAEGVKLSNLAKSRGVQMHNENRAARNLIRNGMKPVNARQTAILNATKGAVNRPVEGRALPPVMTKPGPVQYTGGGKTKPGGTPGPVGGPRTMPGPRPVPVTKPPVGPGMTGKPTPGTPPGARSLGAPGQVKKAMGLKSASSLAPGRNK